MAQAYALYHGNISADNQLTYQNLALVRAAQTRTGVVRGSGTGGTPALAGSVVVNGVGLVLNVNTLDWFYTGYFAQSTGGQVVVTLAANPSGSIRIDRIVAQIDTVASTASIVVVQGTAGAGAPAINGLGTQLQLSLAQVSVAAGATAATNLIQSNVTDERAVRAVCGYAAPLTHASEHNASGSDPIPLTVTNLSWPESLPFGPVGAAGAVGTSIVDLGLTTLTGAAAYTVPANYNLYVTHLGSNGLGNTVVQVKQTAGGTYVAAFQFVSTTNVMVALPVPLIVQAGGLMTAGTTMYFRGVLLPATTKLVGVSASITNVVNYTVPAGYWFVLCHIFDGPAIAAGLISNAQSYLNAGFLPNSQYIGAAGTGGILYGANIVDANGLFVPGVTTPQLFSSGMIFTGSSATALIIHGYTWPQTG